MSDPVVGVLPALGSGLTDLARSGQHDRLLGYDLRHYAQVFGEVRYFSYFDERVEDFTTDPLVRARVRVVPCRIRVDRRLYALMLPFVHARALRGCDVLRVEQFTGVLPAVLARAVHGVPYVVTYGYDYDGIARLAGDRLKPLYFAWLRRVAVPRAAGLILPNPELGAMLHARWPGIPALDMPNGVDPERFQPARARAPDRHERVVLYVGRLSGEKNLLRLVDAVARLATRPVRLVLVGDGPDAAAIRERAATLGARVELAGVVPNGRMPERFAAADCFVLPSLTEGHPKALLEAMSAALPCVVSDRGGNRLLVDHGETGLRVDPEDVGALAGAIDRVLGDALLAARLGKAARERVLARYDLNRLLADEVAFVRARASR
ncbi:MAG: glycosyltransferase family 4 protein [Candidatus Rokubacteria bacterium]|nr:glycosyltransferase family 4 protein [Candidatus Rokubacteria bacterium]